MYLTTILLCCFLINASVCQENEIKRKPVSVRSLPRMMMRITPNGTQWKVLSYQCQGEQCSNNCEENLINNDYESNDGNVNNKDSGNNGNHNSNNNGNHNNYNYDSNNDNTSDNNSDNYSNDNSNDGKNNNNESPNNQLTNNENNCKYKCSCPKKTDPNVIFVAALPTNCEVRIERICSNVCLDGSCLDMCQNKVVRECQTING